MRAISYLTICGGLFLSLLITPVEGAWAQDKSNSEPAEDLRRPAIDLYPEQRGADEQGETNSSKQAAQGSCTEEPLQPGIQFSWGGRVQENDPEGSTNVKAEVSIDGAAEFVPGTQAADRGTWTTFTTTQGVLDIGTTTGGEVIDFAFDVKSTGAGTATYTFSASDEGGVRGTFTCDFIFGEPGEEPAGLSGLKWNDANGNGQRDDGEEGLAGWTIRLNTGQTTTTDASGAYSFTNLDPGTYTVSEAQQDGWTQTYPQGGSHTVTLKSGQFAEGLNFGNQQDEGRLVVEKDFVSAVLTVFIVDKWPVANDRGFPLAVRLRVTNASSEGAQNVIIEDEVPAGLAPKDPSDGCTINLTTVRCELGNLDPQQTEELFFVVDPLEIGDFVNTATAVSDNVPGDDDSAEITVYDSAENIKGTAEPEEQTVSKGEQGTVSFTTTNTSPDRLYVPFVVRADSGLNVLNASSPDAECGETEEGETVCAAEVESGVSFTTDVTFEATEVRTQLISIDIGGYTAAQGTVIVIEAPEPNLEISKTASEGPEVEVGTSFSYTVTVSNTGDAMASSVTMTDPIPETVVVDGVTPSQGDCALNDGVLQCDLGDLAPDETAAVTIEVTAASAGDATNIAQIPDGSATVELVIVEPPGLRLCGQKFVDLDADGLQDDDEPGLGGVTIELLDEAGTVIGTARTDAADLDEDGVIDPFIEQGRFCFEDLPPGTYTVREVVPPGYRQTAPAPPGTVTVELTGGSQLPVRFGNVPLPVGDPPDDPPPDSVALDFGDLPDPRRDVTCRVGVSCYPTLFKNLGPWHRIDPDGPHLGATVDRDADGQPDATALGDDALDDSDDEDGLISYSVQADGSIRFELDATVPPGTPAFIDAWIDLDDDGLFQDIAPGAPPPPEYVLVRRPVANNRNTLTTAPGLVDPDQRLSYARFRITSTGISSPVWGALDGEVEDYRLEGADFGDAPGAVDPDHPDFPGGYPTTLAQDGARHVVSFNVRLGDHIDADAQVEGAFDAREDDENLPQDDEDGIQFLDGFTEETHPEAGAHVRVVPGTTATLLPLASVDGKLDAWVDWNRDGDWDDPGEQVFTSEDIGPAMGEDDALDVEVPARAAPGFTYARFRFSRQGGLAPTGAAPSGEVEDYLIGVANAFTLAIQLTFGDASSPQQYRLVALPGAIDMPIAQTLSGDPGVQWKAFWDDGSDEDFLVEYDASETFAFGPGRGFWLISTDPWIVDATVDAVPLDGDAATSVPLHDGWNIISNPLDRSVLWDDVVTANGGTLQALWQWNGAFAAADTFRTATAGEAFYFLNDQNLDALKVPYSGNGVAEATGATKDQDGSPSALILQAQSGGRPASRVVVGMTRGARDGFDTYDQIAPPGRFEATSLRLRAPAPARSERRQYLAHEWRPPGPTGHTFEVVLRSPPNAPVHLEAIGLAAFVDQSVALIDRRTGRAYDLHADPSVVIRPEQEVSSFALAMGTEAFVERQKVEALPDAVTLLPNYPNPFRGATTLEYALPEVAEVRLAIYDLLGRRVRVLARGEQPAGIHRVRWDGRNSAGQPVASGLYFVRFEAMGQQQVHKITLVR